MHNKHSTNAISLLLISLVQNILDTHQQQHYHHYDYNQQVQIHTSSTSEV